MPEKPTTLSLDAVTLGVPNVRSALAFYVRAFSPTAADHGRYVILDMHGTGQVALHETGALAADAAVAAATSGFRGYIMSCILRRPVDVEAVLDAAIAGGAKVIKPAKKGFFGEFSAVYQAPDGAIWKLAALTKKNTGPAEEPPLPTETAVLLGVAEPKASKDFYAAVGMTVDRDYGNKYIDFKPSKATCRLGLLPRRGLARDAGVDDDGAGFSAVVCNRGAESRDEVDALLAAAVSAGGGIAVAAGETEQGGYAGHFTDPDGFLWQVTAA